MEPRSRVFRHVQKFPIFIPVSLVRLKGHKKKKTRSKEKTETTERGCLFRSIEITTGNLDDIFREIGADEKNRSSTLYRCFVNDASGFISVELITLYNDDWFSNNLSRGVIHTRPIIHDTLFSIASTFSDRDGPLLETTTRIRIARYIRLPAEYFLRIENVRRFEYSSASMITRSSLSCTLFKNFSHSDIKVLCARCLYLTNKNLNIVSRI